LGSLLRKHLITKYAHAKCQDQIAILINDSIDLYQPSMFIAFYLYRQGLAKLLILDATVSQLVTKF
jgi:hypothetical protein